MFNPIRGLPPVVTWLPCEALNVDEAYQRSIDGAKATKLITTIATDWDWRLCAPLTVSHRADKDGAMAYFVIDGQHRLRAAELRGDIAELPCIISVFETFEDEARAFVSINTQRHATTALDRYHARVASKEPQALAIRALVESVGLKVTRYNDAEYWQPGDIAFPDAVGSAMARSTTHAGHALEVLAKAYTVPLLRGADLFAGLFLIMRENISVANRDALARHLTTNGASQTSWVTARNKLAAEREIPKDIAMKAVIMRGFEPVRTMPAGRLAVTAPMAPGEGVKGRDGRMWCPQCEKRVDERCSSALCKAPL